MKSERIKIANFYQKLLYTLVDDAVNKFCRKGVEVYLRNYVEKFDATTLRQILSQAIRLKPEIVTKYLQSEDALLLGIYFKNPPGRLLRR